VVGAVPMLESGNSARETSMSLSPGRVWNARSACAGRPPLGFGGYGGSSGATRAHNASGNRSFAMAPSCMAPTLLPWLLTRRFC
jgi:hypothetical protein